MNRDVLAFVKSANLKGKIVDVGAYNVNGCVKDVVPTVIGVDMRQGKGVDRVMLAEEVGQNFKDLDALTCCETMEHVEHWRAALTSMWSAIKTGGRMVITVPSTGKGYHAHPEDYWRWSFSQLADIFKGQEIEKEGMSLGCSYGLIVKKVTDTLDLSPEPIKVEPKTKRDKKRRGKESAGDHKHFEKNR